MESAGNRTAHAVQMSISPELSVRRGLKAIQFYKAAFGAEEIYRVGGTPENEDFTAGTDRGSLRTSLGDRQAAGRMATFTREPSAGLARRRRNNRYLVQRGVVSRSAASEDGATKRRTASEPGDPMGD
jgi:hypothetical protein